MPPTLCIWHSVGGIFSSQEVIQKIHALNLLLEICAPVHIQGKRYVLMSEDFRKRLYIKPILLTSITLSSTWKPLR